jgi:hypothetical protein
MARSFKFAIARFTSGGSRDERLNVGIVVGHGAEVDVRLAKNLGKLRAISTAIDANVVSELLQNMVDISSQDTADALSVLISENDGPIAFSELGEFVADTAAAYEERVSSILKALVEAEPSTPRSREKRSRLLTSVKSVFRKERVLAQRGEDLLSHRVVPKYQVDNGLVADFVLKNGAMHVVETVDATGDEAQVRKAVAEIGVAALVLEASRMKFGQSTTTQLVYAASPALERIAEPALLAAQHQGAKLINWESNADRESFVHMMSQLATPVPRKRRPLVYATMN